MKIYIVFFLLGLALISIQSHPLLPFSYNGIRPELSLLLVVYMGSRAAVDLCGGAVVALLVGYALSVFSGSPIGLYSFIYVLLFLSVRFLKTFFVLQKISLLVLLVAVSCVVEWVCVVLLLYIFHKISLSAVSFKAILLWQTFYTTLLAPVLLLVFQYIYNTTLQGSWVHLVRRLVLPHNDWGGNR